MSDALSEIKVSHSSDATSWENKVIVADICDAHDLEAVLAKATTDVPYALLIVQQE